MLYVILLSMLLKLLSTLSVKQASDLWQQLEYASEVESDLRYTIDWQELVCCFQCWKNAFEKLKLRVTSLITLVLLM